MKETIHDFGSYIVWESLLDSLATHHFNNHLDCDRRSDYEASKRIDQSIIEIYIQDESEVETRIKVFVINKGFNHSDPRVRKTTACIAGLRGNVNAIPILGEIIKNGTYNLKLRVVKILAVLDDDRCVPHLAYALKENQGVLHREARRALHNLGKKAESAWIELLHHPDSHIRWEAARGLAEIGDSRAVHLLAEGLLDENYVVRWATADVLSYLGESAVPAVLTILSRSKLSQPVRVAAYHALHRISNASIQKRLSDVLEALRSPAANIQTPVVAQRLLIDWEKEVVKRGYD
jgi:HEAT repeat protein